MKNPFVKFIEFVRRVINGPQPDRRIFKGMGIPDNMPLHHPAERASVIKFKRLLPRALAILATLSIIGGGIAAVVGLFR